MKQTANYGLCQSPLKTQITANTQYVAVFIDMEAMITEN